MEGILFGLKEVSLTQVDDMANTKWIGAGTTGGILTDSSVVITGALTNANHCGLIMGGLSYTLGAFCKTMEGTFDGNVGFE